MKKEILNIINSIEGIRNLVSAGGEVYLVGGVVRDILLGIDCKDIDLIVRNLSIEKIESILGKQYCSEVGKSFGILKYHPHDWIGEDFDIALPRKEKLIQGGTLHTDFEIVSSPSFSLEDDSVRRDFTFNALYMDLSGNIIDFHNGIDDLNNKTIRATSPKSFIDDPLRGLRACQFSSRFGFTIEPLTLGLIKEHIQKFSTISGERIICEFDKIIKKGDIKRGFECLCETGIDVIILGQPFIDSMGLMSKITNENEFYFCLLQNEKIPSQFYMKILKGVCEVSKNLQAFTLWRDCKFSTILEAKIILVKMIKMSENITNSLFIKNSIFEEALIDIQTNSLPIDLKSLNISGDDLILMGFDGKMLGNILNDVFVSVLDKKIKNDFEAIINYINLNFNGKIIKI